jgi:UDP-N-acetylmuramoyl-tripeptide--D-alanyl-D-alanine ligase
MNSSLTLSSIASALNGKLLGSDAEFSSVSTDTRSLTKDSLYIALIGERFDGNEFVDQAQAAGAVAAIISRKIDTTLPALLVEDTGKALASLALINRLKSPAIVAALTGSQGKTTVKEMAGAILSETGPTLITEKNLNNTIGVPLTLLRLKDERFAVIEMGANGKGEIDISAGASSPNIVLITKASAAHIEGFGSLQGIVEAKGEIIDHVRPDGVVILNGDDENVWQWKQRAAGKRTVLFSLELSSGADYFASDIDIAASGRVGFTLNSPKGAIAISLNLFGKHNIMNALAASAIALEAGASLADVRRGLASLGPIRGRLQQLAGLRGSKLLDDTYNASPDSFFSAIDVLMSFTGEKIVIAGDMKELGDESAQSHEQVGTYAKNAGVNRLWATGEMSKMTVESFGKDGVYFDSKSELVDACQDIADSQTIFLIKGSRGSEMDSVVNKLIQKEDI